MPTAQEMLRDLSLEQMQKDLAENRITPREYHDLVRRKARLVSGEQFFDEIFYSELIRNAQEGWDTIVEGLSGIQTTSLADVEKKIKKEEATRVARGEATTSQEELKARVTEATRAEFVSFVEKRFPDATPEEKATQVEGLMSIRTGANVGQVLWGIAEVLTAPVFALATATGAKAESLAAGAGASPGLAKFLGLVAELGIGPARVGGAGVGIAVATTAEKAAPFVDRLLTLARKGIRYDRAAAAIARTAAKLGPSPTPSEIEALSHYARRVVDAAEPGVEIVDFSYYTTRLFTGTAEGLAVAGGIPRHFRKLLDTWSPEHMAMGDFNGAIRRLAQDIVHLADESPEHLTRFVSDARRHGGVWSGMREAYMNLAVIPLSTPVAFVGNFFNTATSVADRFAGYGTLAGFVYLQGLFLATHEVVKPLAKGLRADPTRLDKVAVESVGAIPGRIGELTRQPTRWLEGVDNLYDPRLRRASYYADATLEGQQRGLKGHELAEFVSTRMTGPTDDMVRHADDLVDTITLRGELGPFQGTVRDALQWGPFFLAFPIMKTGFNAVNYTWSRTPGLQLVSRQLYADLAAGGSRAAAARGRIIVSNMMSFYIYELAKHDYITGSGPLDPAQRAAWLKTHEPYSVRVGERWVSYRGLGVESGPALIADFAQAVDQMDEVTFQKLGQAAWFSIYNNIGKSQWWGDIEDVIDTVRGERQNLKALIGTFPLGTAGTRLARVIDPVSLEARTTLDEIMARVPVYGAASRPTAKDIYGDPIVPAVPFGIPWLGFFSPILPRMKDVVKDRIAEEGDKLEIDTPRPFFKWSIGGGGTGTGIFAPRPGERAAVTLTPKQRDEIIQIYSGLLRDPERGIESKLLDDSGYKDATRAGQRISFQDALAAYKKEAEEFWLADPENRSIFDRMRQEEEKGTLRGSFLELVGPTEAVAAPAAPLSPEELDNITRFGGGTPVQEPVVGMPESLGGIPEGAEKEPPKPMKFSIGFQPGVGEVPVPEEPTTESRVEPPTAEIGIAP